MAKFGLFMPESKNPVQEYEGDYLGQINECVQIYKKQPNTSALIVAVINLDKGQSIKEIKQ